MNDNYIVKNNEQLEDIAIKFDVSIQDIVNANQLTNLTLNPGQNLVIPKIGKENFEYYEIKEGDTLFNIANKLNTDPQLLANVNGFELYDYIYPKQVILLPKPGVKFYITKEGDTLGKAEEMLNTTISSLVKDNNSIYLMADQLLVSTEK